MIFEEFNENSLTMIESFTELVFIHSRNNPKSSERFLIICKELIDYKEKEIGIKLIESMKINTKLLFNSILIQETIDLNFGDLLYFLIDYNILSKEFILSKIDKFIFSHDLKDLDMKLKVMEYLIESIGSLLDLEIKNFYLVYFQSLLKTQYQYSNEIMKVIQSIQYSNKRKIVFKSKDKEIISILKN